MMAGSAKKILFTHFQELEQEELDDLCSLLETRLPADGRSEVPKGRSRKAVYVALACRLIDSYGEAQALAVAAELLGRVSSLDRAEALLRATQTYLDQRKRENEEKELLRKKYIDGVIEKLKVQEAEKIGFGQRFDLTERYPKLVFVKSHNQPAGRMHEIMSSGRKHREVRAPVPMYSYSSVPELFNPDKQGHTARIIVIQGAAGIGKTVLARKIMLDWAMGKLFQDRFEYVFYVQCRDSDQLPGYPVMADLLLQSYMQMPKAHLGSVVDLGKVLFLIDGFDKLRHPLFLPSGNDKPLQCAQKSLLRRTLLSKSSIIITTRPAALEKLRQCVKIQRLEEMVGFSEDDRKEYFNKFFGSAELGAQVFQVIRERPALHSMCFIPTVCWVICRVLKLQMERGEDLTNAPRTMALLFITFLSSFIKQQNSAATQPAQDTLKRVCTLAKDGLYENKTQFTEEDLHKHGLSLVHIQSLLQSKDLFHKDTSDLNIYSFAHSIFQDFFAALFYVLRDNDEPTDHAMNPDQALSGLLSDYMKRDQNHLLLTVRLIFGFGNTEAVKRMGEHLEWKILSGTKTNLLPWIKEQIKDSSDFLSDYLMDLLYCLHEIQDEEFTKIALESFDKIHIGRQMDTMDMKVLLFCFKNSAPIQNLNISQFKLEAEDVKSLIPWTQKCSSLT
ncbi:NACHT, LRR and PYD domains-containing protein 12-like [Lissotriton helveticus]